ncbi:ComEA family DNA-binding protein [Algoriphagus pacificus]|uniref:Helix-hairpin-helix domain-containing protein n=1 Tax=Algoriphagus pacificus TaxID=2811234 RepID=A0ABS3CF97_9BACT|nr:helix-hairpin-helix domain-containing protein [Algoriphagus pacificus]MBN7815783.1 helix-hairpin-helix domain-containing protein [Algoriphagus pacificus]
MGLKLGRSFLLFFLIFQGFQLFAQTPPKESIDLESFAERLFSVQDEDLDYESIYEVLFQLNSNPININQANTEALQATYLLSPLQISSLLTYRSEFGDLLSLYELQAIPNFDLQTIQQILPFITLGTSGNPSNKSLINRILEEEQAYLLVRHRRVWEERRGFSEPDTAKNGSLSTRYLGDPNDLYVRFRIQHARDFSLGITLDKDAGEEFTWDNKTKRYGFNFFSFHFTKFQFRKWKVISLGDFQAQFGQGLVFGAGYSLGKGAETVPTVRKSSVGILPYTAALEAGFFRGIGATYQAGKWQSSIIASHAPRDGRSELNRDTLSNELEVISSLSQSGLHRTPSELSTKNQFREMNLGSNIQYDFSRKLQVGSNFLFTKFDNPWIKSPTIYNRFDFAGKQNWVGSLYFNFNWKNFFLFGESGLSKSKGAGSVFGFITSLSKQVDFSLVWRKYDRNFHSFYSNAFSEGTNPINEQGLYMGIQITPTKTWKINAYYDAFKFPWLRYRVYAPSDGSEWLTRISYQPSKTLLAFLQVRTEKKDRNFSDSGEAQLPYQIGTISKTNTMISLEYRINSQVFLRSRILGSQVDFENKKSNGFMILQDVQYGKEKWRMTGRVAMFDTDDYDNRQYAFENNVLWTFSVPAFSGQGMRYYLLGQYSFNSQLTAYLRFARTVYTDRESISSGLQTIESNHQTETTFLLRYMLHQ